MGLLLVIQSKSSDGSQAPASVISTGFPIIQLFLFVFRLSGCSETCCLNNTFIYSMLFLLLISSYSLLSLENRPDMPSVHINFYDLVCPEEGMFCCYGRNVLERLLVCFSSSCCSSPPFTFRYYFWLFCPLLKNFPLIFLQFCQ